jgi:hypothetical protein
MTRRYRLAAALLLAAASASGQVEIRPLLGAPEAPVSIALPTAAPLAAAMLALPAWTPALTAAVAVPAAALPPAQARAAELTGALADFGRTDLKSATAGESSAAGESLMLRAMGASADAAPSVLAAPSEPPLPALAATLARPAVSPAPAAGRRLYVLSRPLRETVRIGPLAMSLHALYVVAYEIVKLAIVWKTLHSPAAAGTLLAFDLAMMPPTITFNTLLDLGQRYWRRKLAVLKELARTPGVARVRVLTTGSASFAGPFARAKDNTGLIFVEADGGLPEALGRFGAPIPLGDPAASLVRLVYSRGGTASPVAWTPTLKDVLDGRPLPPDVAAAWRAQTAGKKGTERIEAVFIAADGSERAIGEISQGASVRKIIGLSLLDRARALIGIARPNRAIPVSDASVERPGDARGTGAKAALSRAWRRLKGRLIVAKP